MSHQHYLDRSPEYYIKKAKERSQELYVLIETIFKTNDTPELLCNHPKSAVIDKKRT
jgi:hypothetical protein